MCVYEERQHGTIARVRLQRCSSSTSILFVRISLLFNRTAAGLHATDTPKKCPSFVNADTNIWASVLVRSSFVFFSFLCRGSREFIRTLTRSEWVTRVTNAFFEQKDFFLAFFFAFLSLRPLSTSSHTSSAPMYTYSLCTFTSFPARCRLKRKIVFFPPIFLLPCATLPKQIPSTLIMCVSN